MKIPRLEASRLDYDNWQAIPTDWVDRTLPAACRADFNRVARALRTLLDGGETLVTTHNGDLVRLRVTPK